MTLAEGRDRFRAGEVRRTGGCPVLVQTDLTVISGGVPVLRACGVTSGRVTAAAFGMTDALGRMLITDRPAEGTLR